MSLCCYIMFVQFIFLRYSVFVKIVAHYDVLRSSFHSNFDPINTLSEKQPLKFLISVLCETELKRKTYKVQCLSSGILILESSIEHSEAENKQT